MARKKPQAPAVIKPAEPDPAGLVSGNMLKDFAAWIKAEYVRRRQNRLHLEFKWDEVDMQVAMIREERVAADGRPVSETDWIPELDLPLQAESLEVLVTDARNLLFSDTPSRWFKAHAALTDKYLDRWNEDSSIVAGLKTEVPTRLTQASADAVLRAALTHFHRAYDFKGRWDMFNAECFKYGTAAMRSILAQSDLQVDSTYGDPDGSLIPIQVPVSIKNLYLDDATMFATHEGHILRPGHIRVFWQKLVDVRVAAQMAPVEAGWLLGAIDTLRPTHAASREGQQPQTDEKDNDSVQFLEWEGDLTHVKGSTSIYAPNLIVTIAVGAGDPAVVRIRENKLPFCSYTVGHYQKDDPNSPYGVGPLVKGVPLQKAATETLNDFIQTADLRARPPTSYNPNDPWIAKQGAPRMEPGAMWPALTPPQVMEIGDPTPLMAGFEALATQHANFTGVNQVRLGQSTQTHKSAFAVNQEAVRGQIRTVDYVNSLKEGALLESLNKEFVMSKMALKGKDRRCIWVDDYKGHVEIDAKHLPDYATFEVIGAAGPQEEAQENSMFLAVGKALIEIEPTARQLGAKPLNIDKIRTEALRRTNVEDVASYFGEAPAVSPVAAGAGVAPGIAGGPAAAGPVGGPAQGGMPAAAVVPIGRR